MALAPLSASFQSLSLLPTITLDPSGAASQVGGLVYVLGPYGSFQRALLWGWEFLLLSPQPPQVFSISSLRPYFPELEPWGYPVCFALPLFLLVYLCMNLGPLGPPATALPTPLHNLLPCWVHQPPPCLESSPHRLPFSAPHTGLDECFFFNSLVVKDFHTVRFLSVLVVFCF